MPDFSHAPIKTDIQNVARCDDAGAWSAVCEGDVHLTGDMEQGVWFYGRAANELRLDMVLSGAAPGDQIAVELWAQPQNIAGGGYRVWYGTLTVPASTPPLDQRQPNAAYFLLGAGRGPQADAWGIRAQIKSGASGRRARFRLVGTITGGTLGTIVRGENVVP